MKLRVALIAMILLVLVGSAAAQFEQDPDDLGAADTLDLVFSLIPDAATNQLHLQADLWVFNDSNQVTGATVGFDWDNPNLQMDSAVGTDLVNSGFDLIVTFYEGSDINLTNANQRFLFGGARLFADGVSGAPARQLWASYYFTLSNWNPEDSVVIDTLTFSDGTTYKFVTTGNASYFAFWPGPEVARDTSYNPPSNLVLEYDSLHFDAIEGESGPPGQAFWIYSDGSALDFTLTEDAAWLLVSPIQGTTARQINVAVNTTGLSAGEYIDTIIVTAPEAANSPLQVVVTLSVAPPPPLIGVDPPVLFFNAVAGSGNPSPKTLTVTNDGASVLNWTVSHTEAWLGLSPLSGVDSGDVTVSVDITGLPFGDYADTIVVSDPDAANDPVRVPVLLSIGSDLPVIAVDTAYHFLIVDLPAGEYPDGELTVLNSAAGTMTFWIEETSGRLTFFPDTGTAPADIFVYIKTNKSSDKSLGWDFYDTVWIYSNEAINSPFPVVYQFHYVEDPAVVNVNPDTVVFDMFECSMGYLQMSPSENVIISNYGGDDPMSFSLEYESDYFTLDLDSGVAQEAAKLTSVFLDLPVGDYYDTVLVHAPYAINTPDTLIVHYRVNPALQDPRIVVPKTSYVIPTQENEGPLPPSILQVFNQFGGCMPWETSEAVPWLTIVDSSGNVPGITALSVDAAGYFFGQYTDSLFVVAADATNSPKRVDLLLKVWRFHGDNDYSGELNVADLTYLVDYLFGVRLPPYPGPQPEQRVGDVNCDHLVNVADVTYMVDYLFRGGPIPCGNPY